MHKLDAHFTNLSATPYLHFKSLCSTHGVAQLIASWIRSNQLPDHLSGDKEHQNGKYRLEQVHI